MMNKCSEAEYRFGTTGTLDGTQVNKLVLEGLFGPTKRVTFTRDLQDKGTLAKLKIDMLMLDYPKEVRRINKGRDVSRGSGLPRRVTNQGTS